MFHNLTLSDVHPEGDGAVALTFALPEDLTVPFAFSPGQYLTLRARIAGQDVRRSYSIASPPGAPLTVGVKAVEGGVFSTFAQGLKPGDILDVMAPAGRFQCDTAKTIVLIAAGSGITPMVAMASAALARGAQVTLIYGNRNTGSIMFKDALDALKNHHMDRFTLIHVLSREPQDVELLNGRITGDKVMALSRAGAIDLEGGGRRVDLRAWGHD